MRKTRQSTSVLGYALLVSLLAVDAFAFVVYPREKATPSLHFGNTATTPSTRFLAVKTGGERVEPEEPFQVKVNEFFKRPVPSPLKRAISLYHEKTPEKDPDVVTLLTSAPCVPGCPRPLWLVLLGSLPTGLLWYGYYKFAVEEELLHMELESGKEPRGLGGYGSLGPFFYGMLLGPTALVFHLPGGMNWSVLGIVFIYYTQYLLFNRVNELYIDDGKQAPLQPWWVLPIFFPFNLIVGLRQVHFLSQYFYEKRGVTNPPIDPVADFFPFIKADKLTWQDLFLTPSLWCTLLSEVEPIDRNTFPSPLREFLTRTNDIKLR